MSTWLLAIVMDEVLPSSSALSTWFRGSGGLNFSSVESCHLVLNKVYKTNCRISRLIRETNLMRYINP
jgi:hypothetical protein